MWLKTLQLAQELFVQHPVHSTSGKEQALLVLLQYK